MLLQRVILATFLASLAFNALASAGDPGWLSLPAALLGWYLADMLSGLIHMYMDYRPCTPGKRLNDIFFYEGSRESEEYLALLRERMATIGPFERISYDFKNHHPRPDALGRRPLWRLIGSTVVLAALPLSLLGNLVHAVIHTADIQDRDGAPLVLATISKRFPWLRHVFADGGYAGDKLRPTLRRIGKWTVEIVKRSDAAKGFIVLPRRWVVERALAWLNRNRRLAKDFEQTIDSATAWLFTASIQLFVFRTARL